MAETRPYSPDVVAAESSVAQRGPSWEAEDAYWQSAYPGRQYARADRSYEYYRTAYRFGAESAVRWRGLEWSDVEAAVRSAWLAAEDGTRRAWDEMREAIRDAWDHVRGRSADDRTHIR